MEVETAIIKIGIFGVFMEFEGFGGKMLVEWLINSCSAQF